FTFKYNNRGNNQVFNFLINKMATAS
ncbi:hypothetical protein SAMN05192573_1021, partial [Mucilaginibacter gossypii]